MDRIDEQIKWYKNNANSMHDKLVNIELEKIKGLYNSYEDHSDEIFVKEMIESFCKIIERQREKICDLETENKPCYSANSTGNANDREVGFGLNGQSFGHSFVGYTAEGNVGLQGRFDNGKQLQKAFAEYCIREGKSSYTANDYCSRIKNLWKLYYSEKMEQRRGESRPLEASDIPWEDDLMNAYDNLDSLKEYVSKKIAEFPVNRNWTNARAALNKFSEAIFGEKSKAVKTEILNKDFSKYKFEGNTYGKSRLVLAVVKRYVEDHHPATFAELEKAFPGEIQGSLGIVKPLDKVSDKYKGIGGVKRYFVNEDEIIHLESGEKVIVCTQWGVQNMESFINHAENALGYEIEKI